MKKLKVNRSIYSDEAINQTMMVYKNHAVITVSFKRDYAVITFWKCKYDEALTVKEFENYMIGVENS
jgi:sRNA-binding regulator protein Hfq